MSVPAYYLGESGAPAWDFIEDFGLNYNRGCALKYLVRAGRKTDDPREDLRKAIHCLEREIEVFEAKMRCDGMSTNGQGCSLMLGHKGACQ